MPPKRLSLEAAGGTELYTAAWAIFDAVRAAAQHTALPQNLETHLTRAAGRTVRFCHDDYCTRTTVLHFSRNVTF